MTRIYAILDDHPNSQNISSIMSKSFKSQAQALAEARTYANIVNEQEPNSEIQPVNIHFEDSNGFPVTELIGFGVFDISTDELIESFTVYQTFVQE